MRDLPRAHVAEVPVHTRLDRTEIHALDQVRGERSRCAAVRMLIREALQARLEANHK